jgi:type I restriction enzyme S subunit
MVRIRFSRELSEIAYQQLIDKSFSEYLLIGAQGSANQASITLEHIFKFRILIPKEMVVNNLFLEIYNNIDSSLKENQKLEELKDLLLAKLTRVEN